MYVRLAFAVAAHLDPEVMIVDEVLAVGDAAFQAKCIDRMSMAGRSGTTVLYVSHNLASVQKLCGRCCYIANGRMVSSGDTMEVINSYLGVGKLLNKREFEFGPVRTISMIQHGNKLDLDVDYYAPVAMSFVNLGFIVSDIQGVPLFGTNTRLYNIERFGNGTCGGRVNVTITSPVLLDGMYLLSVWFGDDKEDVFGEPHCLQFEVQDMSLGQRQPTTRENGHIAPTCQWKLTGA